MSGELERIRSMLTEAGISDHEGGGGDTYYRRPTWHMAEEAATYSKEYLGIHDLLEGALSVVKRYRSGWLDGEVVDDEGVWTRFGYAEEPDEERMTCEEMAFLALLEADLSGSEGVGS